MIAALSTAGAASAAPKPPLEHHGRWLTDKAGRVVVLHGFNMVNKVGSYRPEDTGFGGDDARFLKRNGFNTIRLGIIYKGLEPEPPRSDGAGYRAGYLRSIAKTERVLAKRRIFSLLDFHQDLYNERFEGEGWPDWQTLDDGLPAEPKNGFPTNYLTMPALNAAFAHFWDNDPASGVPLQDAYAAAWRHVAGKFAGRPYVAGYDLMNEPWPGTGYVSCLNPDGCPEFDRTKLTPFTERTIAAIREADSRTLAFYEPNVLFNSSAQTSHEPTGDPHTGFSFHVYCLEGGGGFTSTSCPVNQATVFENADEHIEGTGDTSLVTEFGASDDLADTRRVIDLADEHMVGWQYWHYCDCDDPTTVGPGVQSLVVDPAKPPRGKNVKKAKLKLLARPFPQAVAGTPTGFSFDPGARRFELSYSTASPDGSTLPRRLQTEVRVPSVNYKRGYAAHVEGAAVTSSRNAAVLRLKRDPGAAEVTVAVVPR